MSQQKTVRGKPQSEQEARRKLIKGMAGLPAVLTLASGSAQALNSNQDCAVTTEANADGGEWGALNPVDYPANTDVTGLFDGAPGAGTPVHYCTTDDDIIQNSGALTTPPAGWPALGTDYADTGNGTALWERTYFSGEDVTHRCVVFAYEDNGQILTDVNTSNGNPITASCYASFA